MCEPPLLPASSSPTIAPNTISSDWSVLEQVNFHQYLKGLGQDFEAIAQHLGTKTAAMVAEHHRHLMMNGRLGIPERAFASARKTFSEAQSTSTSPPLISRSGNEQLNTPNTSAQVRHASKGESEKTDSSSFSAMARPHRSFTHETPTSKGSRRSHCDRGLPIGQRSLASLTSGMSDCAQLSR